MISRYRKGSERGEQVAFFQYLAIARYHGFEAASHVLRTDSNLGAEYDSIVKKPFEALGWVHAIPNGGSRGDDAKSRAIRGSQMVAEGVRKGVADVFCPLPSKGLHGLYIEFKKGNGKQSDEQKAFGTHCNELGYAYKVAYSTEEAVVHLHDYLGVRF